MDVSTAAQQLSIAGKVPTIEMIRQRLGTGSNSTIGDHLRTWRSHQSHAQQLASKEHVPEELIVMMKGLWERVMSQSEDQIQTIQQETHQTIANLTKEAQQLREENAHWQQQYLQLKQERDGFVHEKLVLEQLLQATKVDMAKLTEKIAGLEQRNQEKKDHIDELHRQNKQIQENLEHYRQAALVLISREKTELLQQNKQIIFEKESAKTQFEQLTQKYDSVIVRLNESLSEVAIKTKAQEYSESQQKELLQQFNTQHKLFNELQAQHAGLSQQFTMLTTELKDAREQAKVLAHEKWVLGQEKAQLQGQLKQLIPTLA